MRRLSYLPNRFLNPIAFALSAVIGFLVPAMTYQLRDHVTRSLAQENAALPPLPEGGTASVPSSEPTLTQNQNATEPVATATPDPSPAESPVVSEPDTRKITAEEATAFGNSTGRITTEHRPFSPLSYDEVAALFGNSLEFKVEQKDDETGRPNAYFVGSLPTKCAALLHFDNASTKEELVDYEPMTAVEGGTKTKCAPMHFSSANYETLQRCVANATRTEHLTYLSNMTEFDPTSLGSGFKFCYENQNPDADPKSSEAKTYKLVNDTPFFTDEELERAKVSREVEKLITSATVAACAGNRDDVELIKGKLTKLDAAATNAVARLTESLKAAEEKAALEAQAVRIEQLKTEIKQMISGDNPLAGGIVDRDTDELLRIAKKLSDEEQAAIFDFLTNEVIRPLTDPNRRQCSGEHFRFAEGLMHRVRAKLSLTADQKLKMSELEMNVAHNKIDYFIAKSPGDLGVLIAAQRDAIQQSKQYVEAVCKGVSVTVTTGTNPLTDDQKKAIEQQCAEAKVKAEAAVKAHVDLYASSHLQFCSQFMAEAKTKGVAPADADMYQRCAKANGNIAFFQGELGKPAQIDWSKSGIVNVSVSLPGVSVSKPTVDAKTGFTLSSSTSASTTTPGGANVPGVNVSATGDPEAAKFRIHSSIPLAQVNGQANVNGPQITINGQKPSIWANVNVPGVNVNAQGGYNPIYSANLPSWSNYFNNPILAKAYATMDTPYMLAQGNIRPYMNINLPSVSVNPYLNANFYPQGNLSLTTPGYYPGAYAQAQYNPYVYMRSPYPGVSMPYYNPYMLSATASTSYNGYNGYYTGASGSYNGYVGGTFGLSAYGSTGYTGYGTTGYGTTGTMSYGTTGTTTTSAQGTF